MSHFESLVAVSSVITFIFSMIEFVPSTLYFLSGFSLTCLLTQVVFPEPGNPTIMITYNNANSTTILHKKGQQCYAINETSYVHLYKQMQCATVIFDKRDALDVTVKYPNLPHKRLSYCTYLTFFLSCRPSCAVYQRLFTNRLNEGVPFLSWEPWLFLHKHKKTLQL